MRRVLFSILLLSLIIPVSGITVVEVDYEDGVSLANYDWYEEVITFTFSSVLSSGDKYAVGVGFARIDESCSESVADNYDEGIYFTMSEASDIVEHTYIELLGLMADETTTESATDTFFASEPNYVWDADSDSPYFCAMVGIVFLTPISQVTMNAAAIKLHQFEAPSFFASMPVSPIPIFFGFVTIVLIYRRKENLN